MLSKSLIRSLVPIATILCGLCGPPRLLAAASVSGQTIVIDPGHGGKDPGAVDNGIQEKSVTLAVGQQLAAILRAEGAQVIMTRSTDVYPSGGGTSTDDDLQMRVDAAQKAHADAFISIHANESADSGHSGATTFYGPACGFYSGAKLSATDVARSYSLASKVQSAVVARSHEHDDGTQSAAFWVLGNPGIPAILVETGFLSNAGEAAKLADPNYQHLLADGVADGINAFFASTDDTGTPPPAPSSALAGCSGVSAKDDHSAAAQPAERWLQTTAAAPLMSGSDGNAKQFSVLPPATYLKVLDQKGDFFYVLNPSTNGPGWVDAKKVAASDPPPAFQPFWVESFQPTQLWSGSDSKAANFGPLPVWSFMQVLAPTNGPRFYVRIADTGNVAYVNRSDVGPSGPPPSAKPAPAATPAPQPAAKTPAPAPTPAASVTVAAGDTASSIAAKLGVSLADLVAANHLNADGLIKIGQTLVAPGGAAPAAAVPAASQTTSVTVGSGDTLSGLAARLGVSIQSLVSLNHLASADSIKIGQTLEVPNS